MKIALVTSHYGPPWNEGVRNIARCLVEFLETKGDQVVVISRKLMTTRARARISALVGRFPLLGSVMFAVFAVREARRANADAVLLFTSVSPALGAKTWLLRRTTRRPLILYVTGLRRVTVGYSLFLGASRIFVNSPALKRLFTSAEIVPTFIDENRWRPDGHDAAPRRNNILFLGAFEKCRGVEYLIQAMDHLPASLDARLILAWNGAGRSRYDCILTTIRASRAADRIELLRSADVGRLYAEAAVVIIPRITPERMAFPVRIVEAIAMGVPLIVTTVNGMDEIVNGCGLAVPPRDPQALAAAIERLLTDGALYDRIVAQCRARAVARHSSKSLDTLYGGLTECRR